ncbi:tripartite tricarboxylate transporter substrate binding protein [Paralcaligenes sp. KSB-10]|uniref:Bug family tripartite tricarboxylate transporter substrate binding protein n=1 Tax=Paralcaligenes sp. KSB-10 TaxID=2901142 RepID=UPI001E4E883C|nr:tripartite tricarboxylate transporter substrate binding protein [Paralcaligenes sp. KSB-10]UHL65259.1 tripartite tricarboxylate transporter substrate binding protein [Paralcaligenes sp. KSB-10]
MKLTRLLGWGLAIACSSAGHIAWATTPHYPDKSIRMIVAYPPGGGTDILARLVGAELGRELGQSIIVINRGGASGAIGTLAAARSDPDGYTILLATSNVTITPAIDKTAKFSVTRDFKAVTLLTESPFALVATPSLKIKTLQDLVELSRKNRGSINYASTGVGSPQQLATELFKKRTGLDWLHVPYQGGGPSLSALLEGQVQVMFSNVLPVLPYIKTGKLVALAQTTQERLPVLPDVPTMAEAGSKNFVVSFWSGILVPAKTPDSIITTLNTALLKVMQKPNIREQLIAQGTIVHPLNSLKFAEYIHQDQAYWRHVAELTHISITH